MGIDRSEKGELLFGLPRPVGAMAAALAACRRHFVAVIGFSALLNLLFIVPMMYMLQIYDRVVPTRGGVTLLFLTLILLFGLGTLALLDFVRSRLMVRGSVRLNRYLAGVLLDTSLSRQDRTFDAVSRQSMREFDALRQALSGPALLALADAPWTPIYILICFVIHPWLGLLVLVGAAALAIVALLNQRATSGRLDQANEAAAKAYAGQEQVLVSAENVRALGMRRAIVERHLADRKQMIALQTEASLAGGSYVTISKFLRLSLQSLALGVGAWLAIDDKISAGAIFAASFLAGRALQPVDQLLASWPVVTRARTAYVKLNEMLSAREAEIMLTQLPDPKGRIEAEGVWVAEPNGQGAILQNISFRVEPGEVVAVAGPSGAGKSTLLRVLAGATRADRGMVRIDGAKQADWDPERLGSFIGFLPQDTSLLAGTVKENIARFQHGTGVDADAIAAAQAANAHDMILQLQGGYETFLGWGGKGLSAGQAQRIGIARALYRSPPIVLLDEPNAHLDMFGETQLVQTLNDLKARGAAVIVVAHRAGILAAVDKILVLRDGRIEAYGPRDEVMAKLTGKESAGNIPAKKAAS